VKRFIWRISFFIDSYLGLLCFCVATISFAITLWVLLADVGYDLGALSLIDGFKALLITFGVMFGFYFGAKQLEEWSRKCIREQSGAVDPRSQPAEDNIKTKRRVTAVHALNDEDHWSEEDDQELERRMKEYYEDDH
jgi:hypothetical protein